MSVQLYNLFKDAAAKNPGGDCLIIAKTGETFSYEQIHQLVKFYIDQFLLRGMKPGQRAGILLPKSTDAIAAMLALNAMHVVYVPLDVDSPMNRLHTIVSQCELSFIIMDASAVAKWQLPDWSTHTFENNITLCSSTANYLPCDISQAYILNTSGSTGIPKPVLISNEAALSFVNWSVDFLSLENGLTFSSIAPLHFDLSVFDIYAAFKTNGTICLFTAEDAKNPLLISESVANYAIEIMYATPTMYQLIIDFGKPLRYDHTSLAHVIYAGEPFPVPVLSGLMELWNQASFYNFYGPTETNVCTAYAIPEVIHGLDNIPIGKSCTHCHTKLRDTEFGKELLVSGQPLFTEYYNNSDDTNRKLEVDKDEVSWYCTGDVVTLDEEGNYVYAGRTDRMIKKHGYRIEPVEIEKLLAGINGIQQLAIVHHKSEKETKIGLFYSGAEMTELDWKQECVQRLPVYMIPDNFIHLTEWPTTSSGKTDLVGISKQYAAGFSTT